MKHHVIGIDLGTTYSAVAAYDYDQDLSEILPNPEAAGELTTPSVVGLRPTTHKVVVGREAKRNFAADPENTIVEIKREMGEVYREDTHRGVDGFEAEKPVRVRFARFPDKWLLPQEISAFVLMKMKEVAEYEIGEGIRDAVVTVPAYFHATQKKATEEAALLAGLYPRQLIPEPTAAAICFGVDEFDPDRHLYLVYDLGGGTFDVSIIDVQEDEINVVATAGDSRLGGSDFDDAIARWAVDELRQRHGLDIAGDGRALAAIKYEAEQAKIRLSTFETTELDLTRLRPSDPPKLALARDRFLELIEPDLSRSMSAVEESLRLAQEKGYDRERLSAILLVGGSTGIPMVRTMLLDYFGKGEDFVRSDLDPASVVARGAATLARRFAPTPHLFDPRRRPDASLVSLDADEQPPPTYITEHSLGVGVQDNRVERLVDRGTNIPTSVSRGGFTNPGPLEFLRAPVYQGEGEYTYECTLIGEVPLGPMEPQPQGFHQFEVLFTLDQNGLLEVVVKHINTGREYPAAFEHDTSVQGDEALEALRNRLLDLYQPMVLTGAAAVGPTATTAGAEGYVPPPPGEAAAAKAPAAPSAPPAGSAPSAPPAEVDPSAPPAGSAPSAPPTEVDSSAPPAEAAPSSPPAETAAPTPRAAPAPPSPPSGESAPVPQPDGEPALIQPTQPVPDQFKSIVRRAEKWVLRYGDGELREAYNGFVAALNQGPPEDELTDLGDDLADAYSDARARAR